MEIDELCRRYAGFMSRQKEFSLARSIVFNNIVGGSAWLIGGSVYRNLAHILYGSPESMADFDFIVEFPEEHYMLPEGWELKRTRYGSPKFVSDLLEICCVPLNNVDSILRRGIEPKIENHLTGTPLTIQSINFDVITQKVFGEIGIKALLEKTVGVNDDVQAEIYAAKKGKSIEEIISEKAKDLGFRAVLN